MKVKNIKQRSLIGIIFLLLLLTMTSTGISVIDSVLGHMDELMELVLLLYILLNIKSRIAEKNLSCMLYLAGNAGSRIMWKPVMAGTKHGGNYRRCCIHMQQIHGCICCRVSLF